MIRILSISTCILCLALGGCTDDTVPPASSAPFSPEPVPVELKLTMEAYNALPGTRAGNGNISASVSYPDMDIELTGTPVTEMTPATRGTSVTDPENAVYCFTVLQFGGTTANAKLLYMNTYNCSEGVIDTKDVVIQATTTGSGGAAVKHRFVVIANVEKSNFSNSLTANSSTYEDFQTLFIQRNSKSDADFPLHQVYVNEVGKPAMVMCGMTDAAIEGAGKQLSVSLQRTVAKVTFNVKFSDPNPNTNPLAPLVSWDLALMNIPNKSYYNVLGRKPAFPDPNADNFSFWSDTLTVAPGGETMPVTGKSLYIPVNLQNTVATSTLQTRRSVAPYGGTYLQIVGRKMGTGSVVNIPVVKDFAIYQIFLGKNFTTDFSIYPNYNLTYNITLKGRSVDDSNVIRLVPGYFSGQLEAYSATDPNRPLSSVSAPDAIEWRYSQRLETYFQDCAYPLINGPVAPFTLDLPWSADLSGFDNKGATDLVDGHENTRKLESVSATFKLYPAATACYAGLNEINMENMNFSWYLPAVGELIGTWIASSSMVSQQSDAYWSSTTTGNMAFYVTHEGQVLTGQADNKSITHRVRGCRNPDNVTAN